MSGVTVTTTNLVTVSFGIGFGSIVEPLGWIDEANAALAERLRAAGYTDVSVTSEPREPEGDTDGTGSPRSISKKEN